MSTTHPITATMNEELLRQRLANMPTDDLRAVLAGSDGANRLAEKIRRQGDNLDWMNRRNTSLRFALKVHEQLHGALTREEWVAARDAMTNDQHRERVTETPISSAA